MTTDEKKTAVIKIGENCFMKTTSMEDDIYLTILAGTRAFSGQLTRDSLAELSAKFEGKFDNFPQMVKEGFTTVNDQYSFNLESPKSGGENSETCLVWRKQGAKAKMKLASIELLTINPGDAQAEILDLLTTGFAKLKQENEELKQKETKMSGDLKNCYSILEQFKKAKQEIEDKLIEEFVPILNAKKERIRQLEAELRNGTQRLEKEDDIETIQSGNSDEDSYGGDTDVEEQEGDAAPAKTGTQEKRKTILEDDQLRPQSKSLRLEQECDMNNTQDLFDD